MNRAAYERGLPGQAAHPEPILAIDPGTFQTYAALVVGEQWRLLSQPDTGARAWPPAGADTVNTLLALISAEAQRGHGCPVERLVLAAPPEAVTNATWPMLLAAGHTAGMADVELVPAHVAAVLDPASGPGWPDGSLVLVCDLGVTWTTGLVRVDGAHTGALAQHTCPADQEFEATLRWAVESCHQLQTDADTHLAGVVFTSGWNQHRWVVERLRRALALPARVAADPELAVLRGLVQWTAAARHRRVPAEAPRWRVEPLSWPVPGGEGRLIRWLVDAGAPYTSGAVLAQVRGRTDRVYDLTAPTDGVLLAHPVTTGAHTGPTLVTPSAPPADSAPYGPPPHRHRWSTTGGWMLTPRLLVAWDGAGEYVHTRSLVDGAVAGALHPDHGTATPERAGVFVDPDGRFCLLTWDLHGEFTIWDIAAAAPRISFPGPSDADRVFINEGRWRLAAEVPDSVSVGRYRRTGVTFWDLCTGRRIDRAIDDNWRRHHPGYAARSAADRLTTDTTSPDRRLRAIVADGTVILRETATGRMVFRALPEPHSQARTAFSADGRFLLATWETDDRSTVDVWGL